MQGFRVVFGLTQLGSAAGRVSLAVTLRLGQLPLTQPQAMITGLAGDDSPVVPRLSTDIVDVALERVAGALRGSQRGTAAATLRNLRAIVDRCVALPPSQYAANALTEILGTAVTLQYPLMQLELFLSDGSSDIAATEEAEHFLSFIRYHLWKLEHLLRECAAA